MSILDLVEWADPAPGEMVHRVPEVGSGEFRLGSRLVVREPQTAIFYHNGRAQDAFGPGAYTLSTENIPFLSNLLGLVYGGKSPFRTEIYFVNRRTFLDLKWGTPQPVALRDPDLGVARLRAFGTFALEIEDPSMFVNKIVGGQGLYDTNAIVGYLRDIIASRFADQLGELKVGLFDLPSKYDEVSAGLAARLRDEFQALGLVLKNIFVTAISTTEETQKAIDERASMGAIGNMDAYLKFKAARALEPSGAGGGGAAGNAASLGLGLGAGAGLGTMMAQMFTQAMAGQAAPGSAPAAAATSTSSVSSASSGSAASGSTGAATSAATLEDIFGNLQSLVQGQLAVPEAERTELVSGLAGLKSALGSGTPDLEQIRAARSALTGRWPWLSGALDAAFSQPAVSAALATAAGRFTGGA